MGAHKVRPLVRFYGEALDRALLEFQMWCQYLFGMETPTIHLTPGQIKSIGAVKYRPAHSPEYFTKWGLLLLADVPWGKEVCGAGR